MRLGSHCRIELAVGLRLVGLTMKSPDRHSSMSSENVAAKGAMTGRRTASLSFSSTWRRTSLSERFTGAFAVRRWIVPAYMKGIEIRMIF